MNEEEISLLLSKKDDVKQLTEVLNRFLQLNGNSFTFPDLSANNRRAILWTTLFQHLQTPASSSLHSLCLAVIRVLSREKAELDSIICEKWVTVLIEKAGLYNLVEIDDESMVSSEVANREEAVEALKCLCNIAFNSEVARALCAHTSLADGLVARLRVYKDMPFKEEIMLYDLKLLFILTALREDIKLKVKNELHGMDYLTSSLSELLQETSSVRKDTPEKSNRLLEEGPCYYLTDNLQGIFCEILKTQFNLIIHSENVPDEREEGMYMKLIPVLTALLDADTTSEEKLMDLRSNIANLLTGVPPMYFQYLTPLLSPVEKARNEFEGRNMDALQALVQLLQYRLSNTTNTCQQYENLSPILTVLNKGARGCREQRKFLRRAVLPPLRDVHRRPEAGRTLRNQLCRLLTTPVGAVRDLAAELLFVLCKEKVGRLVKYTGFGNAAGHLAQKGLLAGDGGGGGGGQYSSSSEDSDTEEYLQAAPDIDPVVGCTRPPRLDPFEGMTDEQKEYEAMKLVHLFDRMVSGGAVRPARVVDGRPQPIEHVLQLRDATPDRPPS